MAMVMPIMPRKPVFSDKLLELKQLAQALAGHVSGGLQSQIHDLMNNPQKISALIEEKSPRLSRELLSVASNITDPFVVGMGLQISKLEEDLVEVTLPQRWKNLSESGDFHTGALCTLAEFTSKVYWDRHLSSQAAWRRVKRLDAQILQSPRGNLISRYSLSSAEREAFLFKLRTEQEPVIDALVKIYDSQEKLIAEVMIDWQFSAQLALGSSSQ